MEYKVHSQEYLNFDLKDIHENPNLAFYEDTKYNNGSILHCITGISWNTNHSNLGTLPTNDFILVTIGQ